MAGAVNDAGEAFRLIVADIGKIVGKIQDAASAAQQLSTGGQEMAASTEEQTSAMQEVAATAEELNNAANELSEMLSGFKV